jgi:polysaccharide pyruvyl transferase WcaK-like protein
MLDRPLALRCFFEPGMWRAWLAGQELCVSRRFHGAIAAMQAGTPALLLCIDDRMRELARFAGLPHLDAQAWDAAPDKPALLREFLAGLDTGAAAARYAECREGFEAGLVWAGLR